MSHSSYIVLSLTVHIICINHHCADFSILINFSQILGGGKTGPWGGKSQFPTPLYETLGTEIEILTLAHLLSTPVLVYAADNNDWVRYSPSMITTGMHDNVDQKSMYIDIVIVTLM